MSQSLCSQPDLWSTADKLRVARQARQAFLDLWLAGKLEGDTDDWDRIVADMEKDRPFNFDPDQSRDLSPRSASGGRMSNHGRFTIE